MASIARNFKARESLNQAMWWTASWKTPVCGVVHLFSLPSTDVILVVWFIHIKKGDIFLDLLNRFPWWIFAKFTTKSPTKHSQVLGEHGQGDPTTDLHLAGRRFTKGRNSTLESHAILTVALSVLTCSTSRSESRHCHGRSWGNQKELTGNRY